MGLGGFGQGRTGEQEPDGSRCWIDGRGAVLGARLLRARVYVKCKYTVQYAMCIIQYASVALPRRRRHEYIHDGDERYTICDCDYNRARGKAWRDEWGAMEASMMSCT